MFLSHTNDEVIVTVQVVSRQSHIIRHFKMNMPVLCVIVGFRRG
jgi:hypothetical protein